MIKNSELLTVCLNCVRFIEAAQLLHIDVSGLVKQKLMDSMEIGVVSITTSRGTYDVPGLTSSEVDAGRYTGKLTAVKAYKDRTGLSLMDSKYAVENYFTHHGLKFA